jgi:hypothetical protein
MGVAGSASSSTAVVAITTGVGKRTATNRAPSAICA